LKSEETQRVTNIAIIHIPTIVEYLPQLLYHLQEKVTDRPGHEKAGAIGPG
jgi:hypothetical protein